MVIEEADRLATKLEGVRRSQSQGRLHWRNQGRLVARQLDEEHPVIRADFDYRDEIVRMFPATFSVPARFTKHMMVVAHLDRRSGAESWLVWLTVVPHRTGRYGAAIRAEPGGAARRCAATL